MRILKWLRETVCRLTGHWFRPSDVLMAQITESALNRDSLEPRVLTCRRCGKQFKMKRGKD